MDLTASNCVFSIWVPSLLPVPAVLEGFGADDIFDVDDVDAVETVMGVDGIGSAGVVFAFKPMNVTLQADSPSITFFDAWYRGMQSAVAVYPAVASVTFTGIGTSYVLSTGFLKRYKPMADAKRLLQPRKFRIEWQSIVPVPVGVAG
jgi:hypothetical protein